jgi:D-alanyl-D-alanine carboxypeptidase
MARLPARDPSFLRCLEQFLRESPTAPGVVARVELAGGAAWTGAAGSSSISPRRAMKDDLTFRIASNTKTFTAATVLRLHELGLLDLDDRLDRFLEPEVVSQLNTSAGVPYGSEITITELLQHTAGLHEPASDTYVEQAMRHPKKRWTPVEQIELAVRSGAPYNRPGVAVRYSNTGYIVASVVIEQVSGLPLAEAFRSLLRFNDLNLSAIHLETLEPVPPGAGPRMRQYFGDYDIAQLDASIDLYGGGGLVSDVHDLCGFWRALFEGNVFDDPDTLERMLATVPSPDPDVDAGLGLFRQRLRGREFWLHTGFWGIIAIFEPETQTTIAAAINQDASHAPQERLSQLVQDLFEVALQG